MIKLITKKIKNDEILPFFGKEVYLKSKSDHYGWFESEKFILPFTIFKKMFFKRLVFTTETIEKIKNTTEEEEKLFLNNVIEYIKKNNICDFIHKPQPSAVFRTFPDNSNAFKWGSYQLEISPCFDSLKKGVYKSQRNYINRAIKDNVIVSQTKDIDEIHNLCNDTLKRQNIQLLIDYQEIKKQKKTFKKDMLMFKVEHEGITQGALVIFKDKRQAFAEYAGSISRPKHGSLKLLHLKAMEYLAKEFDIKTYDFIGAVPDIIDGSKEAGIQKFKKEFGAKIKEGYQFSLTINPFKYFLFDLCLKISFKMKGIKYIDPIERDKRLSKSRLKI